MGTLNKISNRSRSKHGSHHKIHFYSHFYSPPLSFSKVVDVKTKSNTRKEEWQHVKNCVRKHLKQIIKDTNSCMRVFMCFCILSEKAFGFQNSRTVRLLFPTNRQRQKTGMKQPPLTFRKDKHWTNETQFSKRTGFKISGIYSIMDSVQCH